MTDEATAGRSAARSRRGRAPSAIATEPWPDFPEDGRDPTAASSWIDTYPERCECCGQLRVAGREGRGGGGTTGGAFTES